jgi:hypothetical protein
MKLYALCTLNKSLAVIVVAIIIIIIIEISYLKLDPKLAFVITEVTKEQFGRILTRCLTC